MPSLVTKPLAMVDVMSPLELQTQQGKLQQGNKYIFKKS